MFVSNTNLTLGFKSDFRLILHYSLAALLSLLFR